MMRTSLALILSILSLCLAPAVPVSGAEVTVDREEHKTFDVAPGHRLELDHGDGDVSIKPWDQDVIEVTVRYHAEFKGFGAGNEPDFTVEFEQSGDTVRVRGRESVNWRVGVFVNRRHEYVYEIHAPAYLVLALEGDDGDVEIEGWRGAIDASLDDGDIKLSDVRAQRFRLETDDGDVEIDGLEGTLDIRTEDGDVVIAACDSSPLEVRTDDGDVSVKNCRGDFEITVEDGDVDVRGASVTRLSVRASDGDVSLALAAATDLDLTVSADDGDVSLELAEGISAVFEIVTDDGSIEVANRDWVRLRKDHRVTGEIGEIGEIGKIDRPGETDGARGRIRIETADGDVSLR